MDATKNTVPEGRSDTAQGARIVSQGVYVSFEIKGLDWVKTLIKRQEELVKELKRNTQELEWALVQLNAKVSEPYANPKDEDYEI